MSRPQPIVLDFETEAIADRPNYPPEPGGIAIKYPGKKRKSLYRTMKDAIRELKDIWRGKEPLLFQNAKFDVAVATEKLGLRMPPWQRIHDTLFLIAFRDPYASSYSLKPAAERLLGWKPAERDKVKEWIMKNVPGAKESDWGAHIIKAPFALLKPYAEGDTDRTEAIFNHCYDYAADNGMIPAYDRERQLMPILLENECRGVRLDVDRLATDMTMYRAAMEKADAWLRKRLKTPDLNVGSKEELADAFERNKIVTHWNYTAPTKNHPAGQRSLSKQNMTLSMIRDKDVAAVYGYRSRLQTCLGTFMSNMLEGSQYDGRFYWNWNQLRGEDGGARTGRMSVTLIMNMPKEFGKKKDAEFGPYLLRAVLKNFPPLPLLRSYYLPDKGLLWGRRDYNQQEIRILAHYEDGALLQHYHDDPWYDMHDDVQTGLRVEHDIELDRDPVKIINFQDIYGGGVPAMLKAFTLYGTPITEDMARRIKRAKRALMPDFDQLDKDVKATGNNGQAIRTWGGRIYYVQPPGWSDKYKRYMSSYSYKLLNYLIQGSAADCTKQALINYNEHPKRRGQLVLTVHDEIDFQCEPKAMKSEQLVLAECMADVKFDLAMLSEGEQGPNWGALKKFDVKGVLCQ